MLSKKVEKLYSLSQKLLYIGLDGTPLYADEYSRLNGEVFHLCRELYNEGCDNATIEEKALFYLSLLRGYISTFCDDGNKQSHVQSILDCCWDMLDMLPDSLLKVRLLVCCYSETYEADLVYESHRIIDSWDKSSLGSEEIEVIEELKNIEDNPYPWEYIDSDR